MLYLPASPIRDPRRLAAIEEAGLLDGRLAETFDRLTRFGARVLRVPMTNITLIEADRQVVLSQSGLPEPWASERTSPLEDSFCQHVVRSGQPLVTDDARQHPLVRSSPFIAHGVVAYAGLPWRTPDGSVQGAYCAMDSWPRTWTEGELGLLRDLADMVTDAVGQAVALRRASARAGTEHPHPTLLLDHPAMAVFTYSGEHVTYANPSFAELLGYSPGEVPNIDLWTLVDADDRDRVREGFRRLLDGDPAGGEQRFRARTSRGEPIWLEVHASRSTIGGAPAIVGVAQDVTRRMHTEEELSRCEGRLETLLRSANDLTWEWEIASGTLRWSERANRVLRYTHPEMGDSVEWWLERIHEQDRERVAASLQRLLAGTESTWTEEFRFLRGDGGYATLLNRAYVVRDERSTPTKLIDGMIDMTERRRSEDGQRFLARASGLLEDSLDAGFAVRKVVDLIVPELADFCVLQLTGDDEEAPHTEARHRVAEAEKLLQAETCVPSWGDPLGWLLTEVTETGKTVLLPTCDVASWSTLGLPDEALTNLRSLEPVSLIALPLTFRDRVLGALVYGTSVSQRQFDVLDLMLGKDLAQRIAIALGGRRLYAEAQRALKSREEIINIVSHDLRNPLGTISMAAELLTGLSPERREENRKWLDSIRGAARGMNATIEDLLDLSRIDSGRFIVEPEDHEIGTMLEEVREALLPLAVQKGVELEFFPLETDGRIFADAPKLHRVFANLVGNALKFTPDGGRVTVRAELQAEHLLVSIRDSGPGIPADDLPHVFDRYWQARQGDRRGIGMGLAIAKGIVEAHGGRVWAESAPGEGAAFHFTIPVAVSSAQGTARMSDFATTAGG